jgi:hypothetical protein
MAKSSIPGDFSSNSCNSSPRVARSSTPGSGHLRLILSCCALVFLLPITAIPSSQVASASGGVATRVDRTPQEQQLRFELRMQRFISDHTDASGFVRPDLWRTGMEHARQMRTVRNIGAAPVALRP